MHNKNNKTNTSILTYNIDVIKVSAYNWKGTEVRLVIVELCPKSNEILFYFRYQILIKDSLGKMIFFKGN